MQKLLDRQLRRYIGDPALLSPELRPFIAAVDDVYRQADADRAQLERSLDTVSAEMVARYEDLHDALSDSQRAEASLRDALAVLSATLESTTDGLIVVDAGGTITRWNQRALTVLDLRDDVRLASRGALADVVSGVVKEPDIFARRTLELENRPADESFDTLHSQDGRTIEVYSQPQRIAGSVVGRVWSFRDVSARTKLEERLRHSQRVEAIGQLAGGVAHDFNNLLTVICATCDLLLESSTVDGEAREEIAEIQAAAARAVQLTRQLLTFSRRHVVQPVRVDVDRLVGRVRPMLSRLIGEDYELREQFEASLDSVLIDPGQLEQIIVNLVVNARDAMPRGGRIEIGAARAEIAADTPVRTVDGMLVPGSYVRLSVRDTGTGIAPEILPHIFEPFVTSKAVGDGTGLGLATVSTIVREAGGNIAVDSELSRGTTFDIYLPSAYGVDAAPSGPSRSNLGMSGSETILIAEDDEGVRAVMHRTLRRHNYNVITTRNGNEALKVITDSELPIHLVISDVVMPGLSGLELRECLRELSPETKVLLASGYTNVEIGRRAHLPADTRIIQKPFAGPELLAAVRSMLDHAPAQPELAAAGATGA